jgi:hypothetical protein
MEDPIQVLGDGDLPKRNSIFMKITLGIPREKKREMVSFSVSIPLSDKYTRHNLPIVFISDTFL